MRLILASLLMLALISPAHGEDGECYTLAEMTTAAATGGWTLQSDLTGDAALPLLRHFPAELSESADEIAIFHSPDEPVIEVVGLKSGCARWHMRMRSAGTEI